MAAANGSYSYSLTGDDRILLEHLRVPVPSNEVKRIETLRRSKILDEELRGAPFDRFTSLAARIFGVSFNLYNYWIVVLIFLLILDAICSTYFR
jgi:hypothetical protein